jgi:hypothetical protein
MTGGALQLAEQVEAERVERLLGLVVQARELAGQ